MGTKFNSKRLLTLKAAEETIQFVKNKKINLEQESQVNYILANLTLINAMIKDNCLDEEIMQQLRKNILNIEKKTNTKKLLPIKQQVGIIMLKMGSNIYILFTKYYLNRKKRIEDKS